MVDTEVTQPPPPRSRSSWTKKLRRKIARPAARYVAPLLWRTYSLLWRNRVVHETDEARDLLKNGGALALLWHGRGATTIPLFRGTRASILVSLSRDGQVMEELLKGFGFDVIHGSSSKGGTQAIRALRKTLGDGRTVCFSPDGPRGPNHSVSKSVPYLAKATGAPILPVGIAVSRAWRARNWDRYTVPKPFSKVIAYVGAPMHLERRSEETDEACADRIRSLLLDMEHRAAQVLGQEPDL